MSKIKEILIEKPVELLVVGLVGLLGMALAFIIREVGGVFILKVLPNISKESITILLLVFIFTTLLEFILIIFLWLHFRNKLEPHFGVLWDKKLEPYCPDCKVLLNYYPPSQGQNALFECTKCKSHRNLVDSDESIISLTMAQSILRKK